MPDSEDPDSIHQSSFRCIAYRKDAGATSCLPGFQQHWKDAWNLLNPSIQAQFPNYQRTLQFLPFNFPQSRHHRQGNWQVKGSPLLSHRSRGQIHYHLPGWYLDACVSDRCSYPFRCFLYLRGQISYHMEHGKSIAYICLNMNHLHVQPLDGGG